MESLSKTPERDRGDETTTPEGKLKERIAELEKQKKQLKDCLIKSVGHAEDLSSERTELKLKLSNLTKKVKELKAEHCPEDDIEGISCATCDYLDKVLKLLEAMK